MVQTHQLSKESVSRLSIASLAVTVIFLKGRIEMDEKMKEMIKRSIEQEETRTENYEGGEAFKMGVKSELFERVMTSLMEGKFYDKDGEDTRKAIADLIAKCEEFDPEFPLKLASYARNEMNLRSVPIFIAVEACKYPKMKKHLRKWLPSIIQRADELTEIVARYIEVNGPIGDNKTGANQNVKQPT